MKKNQSKSSATEEAEVPPIIRLKRVKSFIKVVTECGDRLNDGLITIPNHKPVWLSLKAEDCSPRYLINEILEAGGNFCGEIGYQPSPNENAICDGGTGFQGGVPFRNLDDAFSYLAQYFEVKWCEEENPAKPAAVNTNRKSAPTSVSKSGASSASSASLSCVTHHLATLLSEESKKKSDFCEFYDKLRDCWKGRIREIDGKHGHLGSAWPNYPGVYVVHDLRAVNLYDGILYVGMTGKLTRLGSQMMGKLKFRPTRWDPYSFEKGGFSYGYNRSDGTYRTTVNADKYKVDCFEFDETGLSAPSFLEASILQAYALAGPNRLPPANNAF
jgi:hypothetical protein